uniref:3-deoxy-7-phosphoheptulonate synthase n=1 Tax=Stenotrophomonas maltophilia TaxID=40324 RepID=UPI0013DBD749
AFGAWFDIPGSTVQGWEKDGKRANAKVMNLIAAHGIAGAADWNVTVRDAENDMHASWSPSSWKAAEARQLPNYPDQGALEAATTQLTSFPP